MLIFCLPGCYQSQNYKIWKQFTTFLSLRSNVVLLLSIAKLQNLKAIHNSFSPKSTHTLVVINCKTTKFESNSQQEKREAARQESCYQSQNYKIWKQFTTVAGKSKGSPLLLSIAKLQNLKAIHNNRVVFSPRSRVVINRKTTKFESNSQRNLPSKKGLPRCYQSQNYKIWKQFTTMPCSGRFYNQLLSIAKLQNLKAIHNLYQH